MKQNRDIVVGALLGGAISQAVSHQVGASPADVFGSPNVAIDTYRNSKGTYVLWSNGRITSAEGGAQDLGHPYRTPDAAARIGAPSLSEGQPLGSPNVAVRAIPRSDATYVLFSNGVLKRPANADAAAGGSTGSRVIQGSAFWSTNFGWTPTDPAYTWGTGGLVLPEPVSQDATAFLTLYSYSTAAPMHRQVAIVAGQVSSDGRTLQFNWHIPGMIPIDGTMSHFLIVDPRGRHS